MWADITHSHLRNQIVAKSIYPHCTLPLSVPEFQVIRASPEQSDKEGNICLDKEFLFLLLLVGFLS